MPTGAYGASKLQGQQDGPPVGWNASDPNATKIDENQCPPGKFKSPMPEYTLKDTIDLNALQKSLVLGTKVANASQVPTASSKKCGRPNTKPCCCFCTRCAAGKYTDKFGATACKTCQRGRVTHSEKGSSSKTDCKPCPAGKYDSLGEPTALPAPLGYAMAESKTYDPSENVPGSDYSVLAPSICLSCPRGTFSERTDGNFKCKTCRPGKWQPPTEPQIAESSCALCKLNCPPGKLSVGCGKTFKGDCQDCPPGKAGPLCKKSPPGKHLVDPNAGRAHGQALVDAGASTEDGFALCKKGRFQPEWGATLCFDCPDGRYGSDAGASECEKCPNPKTSQNGTGSDACALCQPGKSVDETGVCFNCTAGRTQTGNGDGRCIDCEAGRSAVAGAPQCTACAKGTYAPEPVAAECKECPAGKVQEAVGSKKCDPGSDYCATCSEEAAMGAKSTAIAPEDPSAGIPDLAETKALAAAASSDVKLAQGSDHDVDKTTAAVASADKAAAAASVSVGGAAAPAAASSAGSGSGGGSGGVSGGGSGEGEAQPQPVPMAPS